MRTIRDMVDQLGPTKAKIDDIKLIKRIVNVYNHTTHKAFGYRFTPLQVQNNKDIERIYINKKENQLKNINLNQFTSYKRGDILFVHIPFEKDGLGYKRRRNFTHLAYFLNYDHGNVNCKPFLPPEEFNITSIVLPLYYTKFICSFINFENFKNKNNIYKNYFF
jgi:hypothetical protein